MRVPEPEGGGLLHDPHGLVADGLLLREEVLHGHLRRSGGAVLFRVF